MERLEFHWKQFETFLDGAADTFLNVVRNAPQILWNRQSAPTLPGVDLSGKSVLITGANAGIGLASGMRSSHVFLGLPRCQRDQLWDGLRLQFCSSIQGK